MRLVDERVFISMNCGSHIQVSESASEDIEPRPGVDFFCCIPRMLGDGTYGLQCVTQLDDCSTLQTGNIEWPSEPAAAWDI